MQIEAAARYSRAKSRSETESILLKVGPSNFKSEAVYSRSKGCLLYTSRLMIYRLEVEGLVNGLLCEVPD